MDNHEPVLVTDENIAQTLEELMKLEIFLHWPAFGSAREEIENLLDENFWEVGASGKRYNREIVLKVLEERSKQLNEETWINRNFYCTEIAKDNYLLTYTSIQGKRTTERSSIWRRSEQGFKLIYHQGTVVENN